MNKLTLQGKFIKKTELEKKSEKFAIQCFYLDITDKPEWKNMVKFQVINGQVDLSKFQKGDEIEVSFNIRGKDFEEKDGSGSFFAQNITAWRINYVSNKSSIAPLESSDDLPF